MRDPDLHAEQDIQEEQDTAVSGWSKITIPAVLAAAVVAVAMFLLGKEPANPLLDTAAEETTPDSYLTDVRSWQYDEQGALSYTLHAVDASHYPHSDESLLQEPRMAHIPPTGAAWRSQASFGKILPGGSAVELWDKVIVKRVDDSLQLTTESITVYPDSNTADTTAAVAIQSGDSHTDATGMHIDLNTDVIALQADVKARYEPKKQ